MKILCSLAVAAGTLAVMTLGNALPAVAAASMSFDAGNVAFAYNDGYWDHDHHWHKWRNAEESKSFRTDHKEVYSDWKHTRDKDQGWHDEKR